MTFNDIGVFVTAVAIVCLILYLMRLSLARFLGRLAVAHKQVAREVQTAYREAQDEQVEEGEEENVEQQ